MENIDKETVKLIEELCEKEVERTGLPLVFDKGRTSIIDNSLFFHQEMEFSIEDFDSVILTNQNDLDLKNGKWVADSLNENFYGYELTVKQNDHSFSFYPDPDCLPTENEIIERLSSDKFKKIFDSYKIKRYLFRKIEDGMLKIREEAALYIENKEEQ